jgi:putative hydrolase
MIDGVRVLFGVEANIINKNADLDLPENVLEKLDFVIIGFHDNCGYNNQGVEKNTEVLIRAMKNKYVKVVSHPYGLKIRINIEKVTKASIENNVLLELNASYFFKGKINNKEIWNGIKIMTKILKENNQRILINSDAHSPYEIGKFENVINKFKELGINKKNILNNDKKEILNFLNIL